mmetsp:Transcript_49401/g.152375  ORF Transcript_49401/g.152375 Transcript_49401/m.152375 type:complete len:423 (+) Transcript_49401:578-1846(+)
MEKMVKNIWFDNALAVLILLNSVLLGLETEAMASAETATAPSGIMILQEMFTYIFFLELMARIYVAKWSYLRRDVAWNIFDVIVVTLSAAEMLARYIVNFEDSTVRNLNALRVLRVLRVVRVVRIVRVFRFFRELRMMVYSIMGSAQSLLWAMVLLFSTVYVVAVLITQVVWMDLEKDGNDTPERTELRAECRKFFGSLPKSVYFLLQCVTGGIGWGDVAKPLTEIGWFYAVLMCAFTCFTILALLNIITGVFVEGAIQKAQNDKETKIQIELEDEAEKVLLLEAVFSEIAEDKNGCIYESDFEAIAADPRVKAYFRSLGVHIDKAFQLFRLLDLDGSKSVNIQEFVMGCMRLQGSAKNVDVATLMYENKRMMQKWVIFMDFVEEQFTNINDIMRGKLAPRTTQEMSESLSMTRLDRSGSFD